MPHTLLSHASQMNTEAALVFTEGLIALPVVLDPIADVFAQLQVACWGPIKLVT